MPAVLNFPNSPHMSNAFNIVANVISPGQTADGEFPLARFDGGGRWRAVITNIAHFTRNDVKAYRAARILSRGGFVPLVVRRQDVRLRPFPASYIKPIRVDHSDGSTFSDNTKYSQPRIVAKLVGGGVLNDTSLTIRMILGGDLVGGESFSLFHTLQNWRLYEIGSVRKLSASDYLVGFDPPLRDDIADGSYVDFEDPRCVMRIATPKAFDYTLQAYPFGTPSPEFIEQVFPV